MRTLIAVLLAALLAAPAHAGTASPAEIVGKLNAFRAEHGLPGDITLNPDWTESCRRHNEYMAANNTLTHDQVPGRPGYSAAGAWAGQESVLSQGTSWTRGTVFMNAPIHFAQILNPRLASMGASESGTHVCMTSWPGYRESSVAPVDTLYSFPGNGRRIPHLQVAAERPWTPQSKVGIPEGATTGPYVYLWWAGPVWEREVDETGQVVRPEQRPLEVISAAQLTGPDGPVEIKLIGRDEVGPYIPKSSGWILPVKPLQPGALYTATVTFSTSPGAEVPRAWTGSFSFTATGARLTAYIPTPAVESVVVPAKVKRKALTSKGVSAGLRLDGPGVVSAGLYAGKRLLATSRRSTLRAAGSVSVRVRLLPYQLTPGLRKLTLRVEVAGDETVEPFALTRRVRVVR